MTCSGTHTEVLIVQVCGPVESMQYIFPMNFQKPNSSAILSFLLKSQLPVCDGHLASILISLLFHIKRAGRVQTSQYSRLHRVQTSSNHKIFLFVCFWQWRTPFKKRFIHHLHKKLLFLCFDACWYLSIHSLASYLRCCCFVMECSDFSLHHHTV